ncbi:MAG: hypothetical protein AAGH88_00780, partial [Planctomycetota bacterium]
MSRNRKQPKKSSGIKVSKKPRCATHFPEEPPTDGEILFRFRYFDDRFQPAERTGHDCFYDISGLLKSLAISGWNSVIQNRTHHHEISLDRLSREACKRLEQLAFDDLDSLFRAAGAFYGSVSSCGFPLRRPRMAIEVQTRMKILKALERGESAGSIAT